MQGLSIINQLQIVENERNGFSAFDHPDKAARADFVRAWRKMPKNKPLPDTPEVREAVIDLVLDMYGPALRELEKS